MQLRTRQCVCQLGGLRLPMLLCIHYSMLLNLTISEN